MRGFRERRMAKGRRDSAGGGFLRGTTRRGPYGPRTPAQRQLTWRRSERTRRATSIKRTIEFCQKIRETALPFWLDRVLYDNVRTLVRLVREWGWIDPPPPALSLVERENNTKAENR